ncbi:MAG: exonuclease domain-containing protein [Anaerolineae bacterium]|nr:exonuclease domain-containing protein [Anaerolineae bacterium]
MWGEWVAFDLETTGLDARADAIIEIGAVRYRGNEVIGRFESLINPRRAIPDQVTVITNITNEMVAMRPTLDVVLPDFLAFVGDVPVVAHNAWFDVNFIRQKGGLKANAVIDTLDLSAVLLPRAARYSLTNLVMEQGLEPEEPSEKQSHRAQYDAEQAARLYLKLWERARALPWDVLAEIVRLGEQAHWTTVRVFAEAMRGLDATTGGRRAGSDRLNEAPLREAEHLTPIDLDAAAGVIAEGGRLSAMLSAYEARPQQVAMLRQVAEAFNHGRHALIEAGTGVGKTLAYLVPAALWARQNGRPVLISTNTINLQDQLLNKDIPLLQGALGGEGVRAAALKGRSNYLCLKQFETLRRRGARDNTEMVLTAKLLVWLHEGGSGDRGDLNLRGGREDEAWRRLSAEEERCTENRCEATMQGKCPLFLARQRARAAHLVIVNHALLIEDTAQELPFLPPAGEVIIDEAHHLEDAVTNSLSQRVEYDSIYARLQALGGPTAGLLGEVVRVAQTATGSDEAAKLESFIQVLGEAVLFMARPLQGFFAGLEALLQDIMPPHASDATFGVRVLASHRNKQAFLHLQAAWSDLNAYFDGVVKQSGMLARKLRQMSQKATVFEPVALSLSGAVSHLDEAHAVLSGFIDGADKNLVYWLAQGNDKQAPITLFAAPVTVGAMVRERLWERRRSVVLASATLRTGEDDDTQYLRERLGVHDADELILGSPFDYQKSALLYLPSDAPAMESKDAYQRALERVILELAVLLGGRVMGLFTSYMQLRQTTHNLMPRMTTGGFRVFSQSDGSSRQLLLDGFLNSEKSVLLGTKSFWEGVDVPGDKLSALVIARLPFAVPNDPLVAARMEQYAEPFKQYQVPEAIITFRQGFGRLIRSATDKGVVVVMDNRLTTKPYGAHFVGALPDCTVVRAPLGGLGEHVKRWLPELTKG